MLALEHLTNRSDPTPGDLEELLLICRYGELNELQEFVSKYGKDCLERGRDEDGNGVLHMVCGNGHLDLLNCLLPLLPPSFPTLQNESAKSTALHWATVNKQLDVIKRVVEVCGPEVLDIRNSNGRSVITEAEMSEWEEGVNWMMGMMSVDSDAKEQDAGDHADVEGVSVGDVEVEMPDLEGRIAGMGSGDVR